MLGLLLRGDALGSEAEGVVVAGFGEEVVWECSRLIPIAGEVESTDGEGVEEVLVAWEAVKR